MIAGGDLESAVISVAPSENGVATVSVQSVMFDESAVMAGVQTGVGGSLTLESLQNGGL